MDKTTNHMTNSLSRSHSTTLDILNTIQTEEELNDLCNLDDINIHSELSGDDYVEAMMSDDYDINPMVDDDGYLW